MSYVKCVCSDSEIEEVKRMKRSCQSAVKWSFSFRCKIFKEVQGKLDGCVRKERTWTRMVYAQVLPCSAGKFILVYLVQHMTVSQQ